MGQSASGNTIWRDVGHDGSQVQMHIPFQDYGNGAFICKHARELLHGPIAFPKSAFEGRPRVNSETRLTSSFLEALQISESHNVSSLGRNGSTPRQTGRELR